MKSWIVVGGALHCSDWQNQPRHTLSIHPSCYLASTSFTFQLNHDLLSCYNHPLYFHFIHKWCPIVALTAPSYTNSYTEERLFYLIIWALKTVLTLMFKKLFPQLVLNGWQERIVKAPSLKLLLQLKPRSRKWKLQLEIWYLIDVVDFFGPCKRGRARLIEDNVIAGRPGVKGYRSGSAICRMKYIKIKD